MTRGLARTWLLGMVLALSGCGSDSETSSTAKVPTVSLDSLTSSESAAVNFTMAGTELMLPCDGRIAVSASTQDWTARAPGGCGQTQLCGHFEAVATAASGATSNVFAVSSPLLHLPADTLGDWVGAGSVLVRLVKDDNTPYLDPTGGEIGSARNVTFTAPASCDEPIGPGEDGAGGASN